MLKPRYSNQFKKDYKLALKRGKNEKLFIEVLEKLLKQEPLPAKNKDHQLSGNHGAGGRRYAACYPIRPLLSGGAELPDGLRGHLPRLGRYSQQPLFLGL